MAGRIGSTLQSTPAVTCMKILLNVFNFIFWVSGVAILCLGVWMKVELYMYFELTDYYQDHIPWILIGIGAGIVIVGACGCCCTAKGNSCLLYLYSAFLMAIFVAELAIAISAFVYRPKVESGFEKGVENAMNNYYHDEDLKKAMDNLHHRLRCCGDETYKDWFTIQWEGDKTVHNSVPKTCCINANQCQNVFPSAQGGNTTEIYTLGCTDKLITFMDNNFGIIGGTAIGFAFLQLFGALLSCGLAKNINKAKYEQVA